MVDSTPPSSGRPTMRDVALYVGVSTKTVSRVLNDEPGVGATTIARVHEAIDALGFQRNDMARSLRVGQSTRTLGMIIEDVGNPFFSGIARAVERSARRRGYLVITGSSDEDPAIERTLIRSLVERRVDGLLIVPAGDDHRSLLPELRRGMPVVFMDRPPGAIDSDVVLLDNARGAFQATEHLLAHGHRRIGVLCDYLTIFTVPERLRGHQEALRAAGLPEDPRLVLAGLHDAETADAATERLLTQPDPPTAVFATNNRIAVGALRAIHRLGRPVALVGFDDVELAEVFITPLTVVSHNPALMGEEACRLLWQRVDGYTGPTRRVILPTELIVRGSGEISPPP
ncbi:LacI family DNA-binding transcriptional regulator [Nonomuraea sp. NPDC050663]|uniref:LacI family DNA-binding transcriptional regulator n=1 Tax=Nonomuraea sp. NPDC050663 TaxID=3364370 RepID=UPI0037B443BF